MARRARVVLPGEPHHVIQRGNRRQTTFFRAADYATYLAIAAEEFARAQVAVWAYCLMPNHVHLVAAPTDEAGLASAMALTHVRYTRRINDREDWTGCLWQGRFASYPMDEAYLMRCVRYVGLNPVRAGIVSRAVEWPWSSVRAHLGGPASPLLCPAPVAERLGAYAASYFELDCDADVTRCLRSSAVSGRPLGSSDWIRAMELRSGHDLTPPRRGRPPRWEKGGQALFS